MNTPNTKVSYLIATFALCFAPIISQADSNEAIAAKAIDSLIKTCAFESLQPVAGNDKFKGVLYRGLKIKSIEQEATDYGSHSEVTFNESYDAVKRAIPEAVKDKTFKAKSPTPTIRSMTRSGNLTSITCHKNVGEPV